MRASVLFVALLPGLAFAAPIRLTHQGRLLGPSGSPVDGAASVQVRLYDSVTDTTPHWSDTFSVTVEGGFYTVVLGSGVALDTAQLDFPEVWIEVQAGTSVVGRTRLVEVPYAAVARTVDGDRGWFSGAVHLGTEANGYCGPTTAGALIYDSTAKSIRVCDGTAFRLVGAAQIVDVSGSRRWSDGSFASSCRTYRNPTGNKVYEGATGTGVYRIDPDGDGNGFDVYCEMEFDGGGWTNVGYNFNVSRTYLTGTWNVVGAANPVTPTSGVQRSINPNALGIVYTQMAFYLSDPQWTHATRSYLGWWIGKHPSSTYNVTSNACQILERTDPNTQWNGTLVYFAGDGANDNGCSGGGSFHTSTHTCDDGGGGVTTNNVWPQNGSDPLWGYNCISSYSPTGAYKASPINNQGLHAYYVR